MQVNEKFYKLNTIMGLEETQSVGKAHVDIIEGGTHSLHIPYIVTV